MKSDRHMLAKWLVAEVSLAMGILVPGCAHRPMLWDTADAVSWLEQDPGLRLSDLSSGDRAVIDNLNVGCFHHSEYRFEFLGGNPVMVRVFEVTAADGRRTRVELGELEVSTTDLAALDHLMSLARAEEASVCTSTSEFRIAWYRDGHRVRRETLKRSSCKDYDGQVPLLHPATYVAQLRGHDT